jgi:hypothetical protein
MTKRRTGLAGLVIGLVFSSLGPVLAQPPAPKPTWLYAHDLRVRKGGASDFDKDTPKIGVEFFKDEQTGGLIALTQAGHLAVATLGSAPGTEKKATWLFAHDLRARKGDEERFTKETAKYGVEVFRDTASGKLLYVSEKSTAAFFDAPATIPTDRGPAWHHGLVVKVRGPNEETFTKDSRKIGIEAFKDENTGGLIYISETGSIATAAAPARAPDPNKVLAPKALYGLTLRARKAEEADFTAATRKVGIEVFRDENTGGLIYVSDVGSIAAVPSPGEARSGQGVTWKHAMTLKARAGGVTDFTKAGRFGIEVFQDNNTGYFVYVTDAGVIAVLPAGKK